MVKPFDTGNKEVELAKTIYTWLVFSVILLWWFLGSVDAPVDARTQTDFCLVTHFLIYVQEKVPLSKNPVILSFISFIIVILKVLCIKYFFGSHCTIHNIYHLIKSPK